MVNVACSINVPEYDTEDIEFFYQEGVSFDAAQKLMQDQQTKAIQILTNQPALHSLWQKGFFDVKCETSDQPIFNALRVYGASSHAIMSSAIQELTSTSATERSQALDFLYRSKDPRILGTLKYYAASDPWSGVRGDAVRMMRVYDISTEGDFLIGLLASEDNFEVQGEILKTLQKTGDERARGVIITTINQYKREKGHDNNLWCLLRDAVEALGDCQNPEDVALLRTMLTYDRADWVSDAVSTAAAKSLGKIGTPEAMNALSEVIHNSEDYDRNVRGKAIEVVGQKKYTAELSTLIEIMQTETYPEGNPSEAVRALGEMGDWHALPALAEIALSDQVSIRRGVNRGDALTAISKIKVPGSFNILMRAFDNLSRSSDFQPNIGHLFEDFANLDDPRTIPFLDAYIRNRQNRDFYRHDALLALAKLDEQKAVDAAKYWVSNTSDLSDRSRLLIQWLFEKAGLMAQSQ